MTDWSEFNPTVEDVARLILLPLFGEEENAMEIVLKRDG